jgi:FixJ family two-component response regulator
MLPSIGCGWPLDRLLLVILNKQVAFDLGINEKTIKVHRGRVMEKMGAQSLADLVRMAEKIYSYSSIA